MKKEVERLRKKVATLNCEKEQLKSALEQCEDRFNKLFHASSNPIAITSVKETESLRESEEKYRILVENSLQGLAIFQQDHIVYCNNSYASIVGYSVEELLSFPDSNVLIYPEDRDLVLNRYHDRMSGKIVPANYEYRILTKNGTVRWIELYASIIQYKGNPAVQMTCLDRTQSKQVEIKLQESERRFSTVFHKSPLGISIARLEDSHFLDVNDTFLKMIGLNREETIGHTAHELKFWVDIKDRDRLVRHIKERGAISGFEMKLQRKSGEIFHVLFSAELIDLGGELYMLSMAQDISERKKMEEALRQQLRLQDQLAKLASVVPGMIYSFYMSPDGTMSIPFASERVKEIFGLTPETLQADSSAAFARIHPDDVQRVRDSIVESAQTLNTWRCEFRIVHPEKGAIWVEGGSTPNRESDGSVLWHGFAYDITERKLAQERLQRFIVASPTLLYALQIEGQEARMIWVSENVQRITGWTPDEAMQDSYWIRNIFPEDRDRIIAARSLIYEKGSTSLEYRFQRKNGTYMWIRDDQRLQRSSEGKPIEIIGTWMDISEEKRLQSQFMQSQKMETVGLLAGGIAHDFNNLLTVINGYSELLLADFPGNDSAGADIKEIISASQQAASLTAQLLAFSRKQILNPVHLNMNDVLEQTSKMLRRLIGENIELILFLKPSLGIVHADPGQLQQIIMNLAVNARDAMPQGGKLTIETGNVEFDEEHVQEHDISKKGHYVMLAISDTGTGMDPKTQAHIFEPFFTTKERGKGTGLGLSTVYGIVKQSEGFIWVYSESGKGTTFKIYLPRVEGEKVPLKTDIRQREQFRGSETILIVEDEAAVRALTCRMLRTKGFKVIEAADGIEALKLTTEYETKIHLVVTDVIMPKMGGKELGTKLKASHPDIKQLFVSGYTAHAISHDGVLDAGIAFLQKPFSIEDLAHKVREVLDSQT